MEPGAIIVIVADKGGVGKSTTAANLADTLAAYYHLKVGLLDADPQGDTTKCMWATMPEPVRLINPMDAHALPVSMTTLLTDPSISLPECFYTNADGVSLLPANATLNDVDNSITAPQVRSLFVDIAKELRTLFRYSIIDTRRAGSKLTLSLIRIADYVLLPIETEFLAMEDTELTIESIEMMRKLNPTLKLLGILLTKQDHSVVSRIVRQELYEHLQHIEQRLDEKRKPGEPSLVGRYSECILPIPIRQSKYFRQAPGVQLPTRLYIEALRTAPKNRLSQREYEKAILDTSGYARLAEMIALGVQPELYLPENQEQYQRFVKGRK